MDEAFIVFSRQGILKKSIHALEVKSREHARKLWPLVSPAPHQPVTWVKPYFKDSECAKRSHFRTLHDQGRSSAKSLQSLEDERHRMASESAEHRLAKELIAAELQHHMNNGKPMRWSFKDQSISDFAFCGNLLLGAHTIKMEFPLHTPFNCSYRLDIAVLGPPIYQQEMVLGGIEMEFSHAFDGRKALIGKSQGFPLISIDISGMSLAELTPEWACRVLSDTTLDDPDRRRKSYVYLHDLLYPLYIVSQGILRDDDKHQYHVFDNDETLRKLAHWINELSKKLKLSANDVSASLVNDKSEKSKKALMTAGQIVGSDWDKFNAHQFLRITLKRPDSPDSLAIHLLHLTIVRLLLSQTNALVGYQYRNGESNAHPEQDLWIFQRGIKDRETFEEYRVLPKRLAEPISRIIEVLNRLGI